MPGELSCVMILLTSSQMLLYAITQRSLFPGDEKAREDALIALTRTLAQSGVHYLQIREKDLLPERLTSLATAIVQAAQSESGHMRILLNGSPAIAFQAGCHGIHLAGNAPDEDALTARSLFARAGRDCTVSAACHSIQEIQNRSRVADLLLFAPVFEKRTPRGVIPGAGLSALSQAVSEARDRDKPVLALGGVTVANAPLCTDAGAKGIAAIRLFLDQKWKILLKTQTG